MGMCGEWRLSVPRRPISCPRAEERVAEFADLVATAIANTAARTQLHASQDELRMLAEQQAALRRVATLVARGTSPRICSPWSPRR